jgi:predicted permease
MSNPRRALEGLKALLLNMLFRSRRDEQELDEELRAYLECSVDAKIAAGMTPEDARRAARVEIGSIESVKDHTRDVGWESAAEHTWRDVRYAVRTLRKSPTFAAVVVVTLTLGIGANTAIFSAVNAIMLRALPAERPHELISVAAHYRDGIEPFSYAAYRTIAADAGHLVDALAASTARREAITLDGPPEAVDVKWVSGNYFTTLGVRTAVGRPLLVADAPQPPGVAVAVISDAFWARRFGRDPSVVGRGVRLRGTPSVIVGVARRGFASETPGESVDLWMPLTAQPNAPAWLWTGHSTTWLRVLARRRPGVDLAQARAGLEPVYERIRADVVSGMDNAEFRRSVLDSRLVVSEASGGISKLRDNLAPLLMILMGIVGLVLLVACANIATLMLTRSVARRREMAMRLALGAKRLRLVRQGMIEALLLALCGGAGGFMVAIWGTSALSKQLSGVLPVALDISPDGAVLVFAGAISCATALLFGFLPTLAATRLDPLDALKSGGGSAIRGASRIPFGRTLIVAQIAVSLVLLVVAGLFVRSVMKLNDADLGFDPERVVLFRVSPAADQQSIPLETRRQLYRQLVERAASVPGVHGASASFSGLLSPDTWRNVVSVEGFTPSDGRTPRSFVNAVTPTYFDVMRIGVTRGRTFTDADTEQAIQVAIVNAAFARQFFGAAEAAIGGRVGLCRSEPCDQSATRMMEIVGVAEDAKFSNVREAAPPLLYVPLPQVDQNAREIQVRATGDVSTIASTLYRAMAGADRRLAIVGMTIARDRVDASLATQQTIARVSSMFGLLALTLAGVGLCGLVAYMSTQRTQEIGIRMALGASRRDVQRLVLGHTVWLVALGAALGTPAAFALARLLSGLLYEVEPYDPVVFTINLGVLACVALVAGYLPARRAARVDPLSALRTD